MYFSCAGKDGEQRPLPPFMVRIKPKETEKAAAKKAKTEDGEKLSRGRPKGSKNKSAKKPKGTGKRGRPAKNAAPKEESPAEESAEDAE